ncbi:AfsR/SARP family transcriptional regulator [Actinomadura violacea]|uniref:Tetratricopeptide repeat protein n=1 Tax=Actinomadura violacea TaxID=2819934 RepID=A0ABS3RNJ3_9ACTN|nr:BTAD domain-containing putative transcriptional regulator [Actinomadura violacea]MBO2458330.1 tetratricopeptide repeat protein [Actinomadura violacea]
MELHILGPLEIRHADRGIAVNGSKPRTVLKTLLLHHDQTVHYQTLSEMLWGDGPPSTSTAQIYTYVSRLRKALAPDICIVRQQPGYLLRLGSAWLDYDEFRELVRRGRGLAVQGRHTDAAAEIAAALSLWRGADPLADAADFLAIAEQPRLEEEYMTAVEQRIGLDLVLGRHHDLISELTRLVAEHPYREKLHEQLMTALYRSGRQADALGVYDNARRNLLDDLGIDPGDELRAAHHAILNQRPLEPLRDERRGNGSDLDRPHDGSATVRPPAGPAAPDPAAGTAADPAADAVRPVSGWLGVRPAMLPRDVTDFTGREEELRRLLSSVRQTPDDGPDGRADGYALVTVISGMPGVGKTALAVRAAHLLADEFPDGQLYVDLRRNGDERLDPAEVLAWFLRALGGEELILPGTLEERHQLYRSRLIDRRVLIVLDNAADVQQVRPLLPGGTMCRIVVTSSRPMASLEGSRHLPLAPLSEADGLAFVAAVAPEHAASEPEAARRLVELCGGLPIALRIACGRCASRPHRRLSGLVTSLVGEQDRLDEFQLDDLDVRASLRISYDGLRRIDQRAFRALGALDVADLPAWSVGVLLGVSEAQGVRIAERLADAWLLEIASPGRLPHLTRYRFHDLVRLFARELAEERDGAAERDAVLDRALGAWLTVAAAADRILPTQCFGVISGGAPRWQPDPRRLESLVADPFAWFDAEFSVLVALVQQACRAGRTTAAWELMQAVTGYFDLRHRFDEWTGTHQAVLAATHRAGDRLGEAVAHRGLAELAAYFKDADAHRTHAESAQTLFRELGERSGEVDALVHCADSYRQAGDHERAAGLLNEALTMARQAGHRVGEAQCFAGLAEIRLELAQPEAAMELYRNSQAIWTALDRPRYATLMMRNIGIIERETGRFTEAAAHLEECRSRLTAMRDWTGVAYVLISLGDLYRLWDQPERARSLYRQAIGRFADLGLGGGFGHAVALRGLGEVTHALGGPSAAIGLLEQAVRLWETLAMPLWETRTLLALGDAQLSAGSPDDAAASWRRGLDHCVRLGYPEGAVLRSRLDALEEFGPPEAWNGTAALMNGDHAAEGAR